MQNKVISSVLSFLNWGCLLKEVNKTFITLIPKVEAPQAVSDFRLMSLCNVLHKAKVLVIKLKKVMPKLVSQFQNAFIPGKFSAS